VKLIKFIFRWTLRLFLLLVVLVVVLVLCKDAILRSVVERQISRQTGMETHVGKFGSHLTSPVVDIENLRLYNPPEFGGAPFVRIPELHLEYDLDAARRGRLGFKLVRFNLAELNVVRNEAGQLNIKMKSLSGKGGGAAGSGKGRWPQVEFGGIGMLNLTLGKVRFTDLKTPTNNRVVDLDVRNEIFKNIKSEDELYGVLMLLMWRHGMDFGGGLGGLAPLKL
jgi:uncharacterized protein involved in outer membrane biogenesis